VDAGKTKAKMQAIMHQRTSKEMGKARAASDPTTAPWCRERVCLSSSSTHRSTGGWRRLIQGPLRRSSVILRDVMPVGYEFYHKNGEADKRHGFGLIVWSGKSGCVSFGGGGGGGGGRAAGLAVAGVTAAAQRCTRSTA